MREDTLDLQVNEARRTIASDGYPMSIGEITSLYREGELVIRPEFQRLFRWTNVQKSRLVESILLGIPLPSIFVSQLHDGKWELVDGLQRVSTILQMQGELRDEGIGLWDPLTLGGTKYLPALEGRQWETGDPETSLSAALKLDVKRAKIDIKILKRESSQETKFDLFQRLNSYGSTLTAQEVRTALLVGASADFFAWLLRLSQHHSFTQTVVLSESDVDVRYDLELVLRFLVLHSRPSIQLSVSSLRDFSVVLDEESLAMAKAFPSGALELENTFKRTFDIIEQNGGSDLFSRWDVRSASFKGTFLNSAFEILALGLGYHVALGTAHRADLVNVAKELWARKDMAKGFATGKSTESRLTRLIPLGRTILTK